MDRMYFDILQIKLWIPLVKYFNPHRPFGGVPFPDLYIPGECAVANHPALNLEQSRAAGAKACALRQYHRDPGKREDDMCKSTQDPPF